MHDFGVLSVNLFH